MQHNCISYISAHRGHMLYESPIHAYLVGRLHYFPPCCHAQRVYCKHVSRQRSQKGIWHMPGSIRTYVMQARCYQLAVYRIMLPSKPSREPPDQVVNWNMLISTEGKKKKKRWFVMTATQFEISAYDWINGDWVVNYILCHLGGCCPGFRKYTDRVPDIYGSAQGYFMASVNSCCIRAF